MTFEGQVLEALQTDVRILQEAQVKMERLIADLQHHDEKQQTLTERMLVDLAAISHVLRGEDGKDSLLIRFALAERMMQESAGAIREASERRWDLLKGMLVGIALIVAGAVLKWMTEGHH